MLVELEFQDDICILRLEGRFVTGADVDYLRARSEEIKSGNCRKVLMDFRKVPYIDSTGIAFVVGLYTAITKNPDGRFAIAGPNRRVREVLELTRLTTVMSVFQDVDSALAMLRAEVPQAMRAHDKD